MGVIQRFDGGRRPLVAALWLALGLVACGDDSGEACSGVACADAGADIADGDVLPDYLPEPVCNEGTFYEAGTQAFRDATTEWGLDGVEGLRISLGDVDGDGWVDAFVRTAGTSSNDWNGTGERFNWLLRNTGSGFVDITLDSGIDDRRYPTDGSGRPYEVIAFGDVDNDGDLDVYTGTATEDRAVSGNERSEIMLNSGDGFFSFTRDTNPLRRLDAIDAPAGAAFVDADRDGNLDLWVPQYQFRDSGDRLTIAPDVYFRGGGDGLFADITELAGLATEPWGSNIDALNAALGHSRAWSGAACDLNNDGTTELLAASYGRAPNHLWQGTRIDGGGIEFDNRSVASGYAYDDDMRWDDNQNARCFCQENPDAEGCADLDPPQIRCPGNWNHTIDREPVRLGGNSGATVCADLNNDGWMDLLTTEIKHWWAGEGADESTILLNAQRADVTFDRSRTREQLGFVVPHVTGIAWDEGHISATVLDFDNDGWLDFYIGASEYAGNYGLLYHQQFPEFWAEVPVSDGIDHNRAQGVAAADFDRDGDLDVLVGHSLQRCDVDEPNNCYATDQVRLFENVLGDAGNWVQLDLEGGAGTNRAAIGARVTLAAGDVTQTREVDGGYGSFGAQNDRVLHFGLGDACVAEVTVRWPNAALTEQTFQVVSGYRYRVVQGELPVVVE